MDTVNLLAAMKQLEQPQRSTSAPVHQCTSRRFSFLLVLWCSGVLVPSFLFPTPSWAYTIRVAVLQKAPGFVLSLGGPYEVFPLYSSESLYQGVSLKEVSVVGTQTGIQIGNQKFPVFGIAIHPYQKEWISLNQRHFRGRIDIYRQSDQTLLVVNHVDVENYLQGVLYHEVSHHWPLEVLKAQAIAARTYALYQATVSREKDFDVTSDVFSQVYGGATSEKRRTNKAVWATQGQILIWRNQIFPPYYHATCGGHTLASRELWGIDIPPLAGVECSFCQNSPHFHWKQVIPIQEALRKLKKEGYELKDIDGIEVSRSADGGRALDLLIFHPDGELQLGANAFRLAIGPNLIRSTLFTAKVQKGKLIFEGRGWGHGVGMCQWGAYGMAQQGEKAEEILKHYYPGAEIVLIN